MAMLCDCKNGKIQRLVAPKKMDEHGAEIIDLSIPLEHWPTVEETCPKCKGRGWVSDGFNPNFHFDMTKYE
jgi:hypothetical protein